MQIRESYNGRLGRVEGLGSRNRKKNKVGLAQKFCGLLCPLVGRLADT